jgi:hypothetical protein
MRITQQKSTCCQASVIRFGGKRRQCTICRHTWRVHPAKRGPKVVRRPNTTLERYRTNCIGSLAAWAASRQKQPRTLQKQVARSRDACLGIAGLYICLESHILLADALHQKVLGRDYTTYLILARPLKATQAEVCYAHTVAGSESGIGWQAAVAALPTTMLKQTKALVCEGHAGLTSLARRHGWVLQRCGFHLIQSLNKNMRLWYRAMPEVYRIHELVHVVVESMDDEKVARALGLLGDYAKQTKSPEAASILRGLVRHFRDYRSYIYFPELHLPATNNSCECSFRRTRALQDKARGWRSPTSHAAWVRYVLTHVPAICCRESEPRL